MEANQEDSQEPRLRRPMSKKDSFPRSLSASDGNNTSEEKNRLNHYDCIKMVSYDHVAYMIFVLNFFQEK